MAPWCILLDAEEGGEVVQRRLLWRYLAHVQAGVLLLLLLLLGRQRGRHVVTRRRADSRFDAVLRRRRGDATVAVHRPADGRRPPLLGSFGTQRPFGGQLLRQFDDDRRRLRAHVGVQGRYATAGDGRVDRFRR